MNTINGEAEEDERSSEAADLLEEFWFFGNLLRRKNRDDMLMKRWFSDPCSNNQERMDPSTESPPQVTGAPAVKSTETKKSSGSSGVLLRTPSLPPCLGKDQIVEEQRGSRSHTRLTKHTMIYKGTAIHPSRHMEKNDDPSKEKLVKKFDKKISSSKILSPSPQGIRNGQSDLNRIGSVVEDEDGPSMDQIYQLMMGKNGPSSSHREASSLKSSNPKKLHENIGNGYDCDVTKPSARGLVKAPSLPPYVGKVVEIVEEQRVSQSLPRLTRSNRQASLDLFDHLPPRRFPKGSPTYLSTDQEMKRRILNRTKSVMSRVELESEEVQGFKDLGFTFDGKDLNPNLVSILPGLQQNNQQGKEKVKDGPYLSESWLSHNFETQIPKWTHKGGGSIDDLKAQIKFWARAVASNVGQEC